MTTDLPKPQPESSATVLVTLGRIEERLNSMKENEGRNGTRLDAVEKGLQEVKNELSTMRGATRPKAPWWAVTGAVVGIVTGIGTLVALLVFFSELIALLGH